jgi:hypothetical protein
MKTQTETTVFKMEERGCSGIIHFCISSGNYILSENMKPQMETTVCKMERGNAAKLPTFDGNSGKFCEM